MEEEDKIINDFLNPVLGELMQQSLTSILEMKNQNILSKDTKDEILFIAKFIDDAEQYFSSIKDARNLAILSDLKQYILDLTT
jgi:hypothetical protein